ncbi:putative RNA-binding protein [Ceratocystis lukuohia]|uniref:RNA-binding protein n=1 Tax=Ceratocystis lukuohia TaxID=2019550 RepID=A0ABR4MI66_9PEZI
MTTPVGQDNWLAYLEEASRNVKDIESCTVALEHFRRATNAETGSLEIWRTYCEFFHSLYVSSLDPRRPGSRLARWSNDELMMAHEMFTLDATLQLWQEGYEAIRYRLSDSHILWNRWIGLEMEQLVRTQTPEGIRRITHLYRNRLVTPHVQWDQTASSFASFLSEFNRPAWESTMQQITESAQTAKAVMRGPREDFEYKLDKAQRENRHDIERAVLLEYLDWEVNHASFHVRKNNPDCQLLHDVCTGLFSRALTGIFTRDEGVWEDYIVHLCSNMNMDKPNELSSLLHVLQRATDHCPWSGNLWSRYILAAEQACTPFEDVERIKHAATASSKLLEGGLESLVSMYIAWCGFLKRRAVEQGGESLDHADMGFAAALEDIKIHGRELYGNDEYKGDPMFRVERIFIEYLTEAKRNIGDARDYWNTLARKPIYADNYIFWQQYFSWEMIVYGNELLSSESLARSVPAVQRKRVPFRATAVLKRAIERRTLDWPEQLLEFYMQHCNEYETVDTIRSAQDIVRRTGKFVAKRRDREREAAYADHQTAQQAQAQTQTQTQAQAQAQGQAGSGVLDHQHVVPAQNNNQSSPSTGKRKRDSADDSADGYSKEAAISDTSKRPKNDSTVAMDGGILVDGTDVKPKRDRENTTVVVSGLPGNVTVGGIKKYLREFGQIHNVLLVPEADNSTTAMVEFDSCDDARSVIMLRNGKYFGESQLTVSSGFNLTVFVTNYPPAADDAFIRDLFKGSGDILSIRWPSLKYNTHRRFCYVTFRSPEASAKAVALDGKKLENKYRLEVKYSDPANKRKRQGATSEGREVHVGNVDGDATEDELRAVFSKYGTVESVRLLRAMSGRNFGTAFVVFGTVEQAIKAAEELNNVKFRTRIIRVEVSQQRNFKTSAKTTVGLNSAADDTGTEGGLAAPSAVSEKGLPGVSAAEIDARTIALMGLPDTVNDARVKALVAPIGEIIKLVLLPAQGGAKIEFADSATAGKAQLQLSGVEFEGRTLRTGTVKDLRNEKAPGSGSKPANGDKKPLASQPGPATGSKAAPATKLFAPPKRTLGKGGPKRSGLAISGVKKPMGVGMTTAPATAVSASVPPVAPSPDTKADVVAGEPTKPNGMKNNADFKALFLASKKEKDSA